MSKVWTKKPPEDATILAVYESESRSSLKHYVYQSAKSGFVHCTCEDHTYRHGPCKHMKDWATNYRKPVMLASVLGEQITWILESI